MKELYNSIFGKPKTYNDFKKCIICLIPPNENDKDTLLTDEHIVPEFIGGKIVVKNVCKKCNSKLGHSLEGPLSNNQYFKLYAYINKIKGKKNKLVNPLAGTYSYNDMNFRYQDDFTLYHLPVINTQPTEDGGYKVGVTIDTKDLNTIEKDIFKALNRRLNSRGLNLKEEKLRDDIKKILNSSKDNIQVVEQPEIQVTFSLDYDHIGLLAIKIIYELIAWLAGEDFISSNQFELMRYSLKNLKLHSKLKYKNYNFYEIFKNLAVQNPYKKIEDYTYIEEIFGINKTIVIFMSGSCSIRLLNIWYNFIMPQALKNTFIIFTSDSKTGKFNFYREDIFLLYKNNSHQ
ncbi:HNH endonuclease [Acinetobacter pittii]|uniref:HNH endonuclease n=1 Tax=Acinetobacter pittii TaxID=48296 RepID=UPI003A8B6FDD